MNTLCLKLGTNIILADQAGIKKNQPILSLILLIFAFVLQ